MGEHELAHTLLFRDWCENHSDGTTSELRLHVAMRNSGKIFLHLLHDDKADFTVGIFTTTELKLNPNLVSLIEKFFGTSTLDIVIMLLGPDAKFHFLHLDWTLALGSFLQLGLLVFVLAIIDNTTNRRISLCGNLDKIKPYGLCLCECLMRSHDAELLAFAINNTDFWSTNFLVHAGHIPARSPELLFLLSDDSSGCV